MLEEFLILHMFIVCLFSALGFSSKSRQVQADTWFTCTDSIEGVEACNHRGLGAYVSWAWPPPYPRPSVFYPLTKSSLTFTDTFVSETLGVQKTDQLFISGKFSGVFTANVTGNYTFELVAKHSKDPNYSDAHFKVSANTGVIDMDMSAGGTKYTLSCERIYGNGCYHSNQNLFNSCKRCTRIFYLVAGGKYPMWAGLEDGARTAWGTNLYIDLTFTTPNNTVHWVRDVDATMNGNYTDGSGVDSNSSSSVSGSDSNSGNGASDDSDSNVASKTNGNIGTIIGVSVSTCVVLAAVICAVVVWAVMKKRKSDKEAARSKRSKSGASSKRSSHKKSGSSSHKKSSGASSSRKRRKSSGASSSRRRRKSSGASSRKSTSDSSHTRSSGSSGGGKSTDVSSKRSEDASSQRKSSGEASQVRD